MASSAQQREVMSHAAVLPELYHNECFYVQTRPNIFVSPFGVLNPIKNVLNIVVT